MEKRRCEIQSYKKGQVIFKEGDKANCMYDIHCGSVGIYVNYGTKQEKLLTTLQADEYFGEMGLVDFEPRSATAVAMEKNTKVQVITRDLFGFFIKERPTKVMKIMKHMSQRLRELTEDYMEVCGTMVETDNAENTGSEISEELQEKLMKYNDIYQESIQEHE